MDKKVMIAAIVVAVVVIAAVVVVMMPKGGDEPKVDKDYIELGLTNNFFPDHTCCVIAANYQFAQDSPEVLEKFLAGYHDGVLYVLEALEHPSSFNYLNLVSFTKEKVPGLNDQEIKDALEDIAYLYADDTYGNLDVLESDMVDLLGGLKEVKALTKDVADPAAFAGYYVDDTYLKEAINGKSTLTSNDKVKVKVSVITGDIHQIAVHVAQKQGYFDNYGIEVEFAPAQNGGGVATSLLNGDCSIGLMGAPPATINMVNNGYIDSTGIKDAGKAYNLVARVNSEGSGLYIDKSVLDNVNSAVPMRNGVPFYEEKDGVFYVTTDNAKAWGGLIMGTPGTTSIQHIQLLTLAKELGLKTSMYTIGEKLQSDTLYYVTNLSNYQLIITDISINGGIIWEPQYQKVIQEA